MSGLETVKVIVDAERQAAKIIDDANAQAANIRKGIGTGIQEQRQQMLEAARKDAAAIVARAEAEGKLEADAYQKESAQALQVLVAKASTRKDAAVEKLLAIIMRAEK